MFTLRIVKQVFRRPELRLCSTEGPPVVKFMLENWRERFESADIPEPKESIENILTHVLGSRTITDVYKNQNKELTKQELDRLTEMCYKRLQRLPVQYIIEEWNFRGLVLKMKPPVFIPRPETEMLVDLVLEEMKTKNVTHVLDLCCGSGAISVSLLHESPQLKVTAVDQSKDACNLTIENAELHNLSERLSVIQCEINQEDDLNIFQEKFDIIVCNPPYVLTKDMSDLLPEIALFEDLSALHGGSDGLDTIKIILPGASKILNRGGKIFMEVDQTHPPLIKSILESHPELGLTYFATNKDFCDKDRFATIIKLKQ